METDPTELGLWEADRFRLSPGSGVLRPGRPGPPSHRRGEAFLRGPIPFGWVATACRLPGAGPNVALALRFLRGRFRLGRDRRWTLGAVADGLGVSGDSVRRGLRAAERAGLVAVDRRPGCRIIVADVAMLETAGADAGREALRGPVPWTWLRPALRLPGSAVRVGLACWLRAGSERSGRFELATGEWGELGLSRFSAGRGLLRLAEAGLVSVEHRPGLAPLVTLRDQWERPGGGES